MSGGNQTEGHSKGKATKARDRAESPDAKRQKLQDGKGGSKWPVLFPLCLCIDYVSRNRHLWEIRFQIICERVH